MDGCGRNQPGAVGAQGRERERLLGLKLLGDRSVYATQNTEKGPSAPRLAPQGPVTSGKLLQTSLTSLTCKGGNKEVPKNNFTNITEMKHCPSTKEVLSKN